MGWGGRGISLINKGVDFDGSVCVLFCVRQDENHALVAFAVQIMCYYACALLGAVSVQVAFFFSCPWGGVYSFAPRTAMVVVCDNVIRRCLSGLGNTVVMVFAAPFGITIRGILMHAGVSRFSACVNSEWLQAVRAVICELRRGFLGSDFYVDCLLPDALDEDKVQQRLQSVLNIRFGNESIPDATVWWYNTQLYLHYAISKKSMFFQDLLYCCHVFSVYAWYDFEIFEGVYRRFISEYSEKPLPVRVFCDARFVSARDMGCRSLGRSIHEVLQTLICALSGTTFCPDLCGCADSDLFRETSTS